MMGAWNISQEYLQGLRKARLWTTALCAALGWSFTAYLYTVFAKHDLWGPVAARHPIIASYLVVIHVFFLVWPLLAFWFVTAVLKRAQKTQVALLDRLVYRVGDQEQQIAFSDLSQIWAVRSWNGNLTKIHLLSRKGSPLILWGLERFGDFLSALKQAAPSCSVQEWKVPNSFRRAWLLVLIPALVITGLALQGSISKNLQAGLLGLLVLGWWWAMRSCGPACSTDENVFSVWAGPRHRWLDFAFVGVVLYLLTHAIGEGVEAVRENRFTDLLSLFFTPLILAWFFVVPVVRRVRFRQADRLSLACLLSIVVGVRLVESHFARAAKASEIGVKLVEEKQYQKAIPYLETAWRRAPQHIYLAEHLAYTYSMTGRPQDTITILEELNRRFDQPSEYAWELLARACQQTGQWQRLLDIAAATIRANPHSVQAYHMAGFAASQLYGLRSEEARTYYAKYLELEPDAKKTAFIRELFPDLFARADDTEAPQAPLPDWKWVDVNGKFTFFVPPDMEAEAVQGTDSYVGQYRSANLRLYFDYGWWPGNYCDARYTDQKPQHTDVTAQIGGQQARLVTFYEPHPKMDQQLPYIAVVCFADLGTEGPGQKITLTMWANGKGEADQQIAEKIFRSIQFPPR